MAFISKQCVTCTEPTKRECGKYRGSDEKGKYSGPLYECNNVGCKIYYGRGKTKSQLSFVQESKFPYDQNGSKKASSKSGFKNK